MSSFKLSIYTPGGVVVSGFSCEELLIPTETGMINVLAGHTHLISELDTGIMQAKLANGQIRYFTIAGGLCKILGEQITILAKTSEGSETVDLDRAKAAKAKAESRIQEGLPSVSVLKYQRKLERAKNRIKLANLK